MMEDLGDLVVAMVVVRPAPNTHLAEAVDTFGGAKAKRLRPRITEHPGDAALHVRIGMAAIGPSAALRDDLRAGCVVTGLGWWLLRLGTHASRGTGAGRRETSRRDKPQADHMPTDTFMPDRVGDNCLHIIAMNVPLGPHSIRGEVILGE